MKFIWVINGRKLRQLLLIVTSALIAAAIAFVNSEQLAVFSTKDGPRAISKVKTDKKQIALTFDIGWGEMRAKPILKVLEEEGITATFFISGSWAERHPGTVKQIAKAKHEMGLHGFAHNDYRSMTEAEIRKDLLMGQEAVKKASGEEEIKYLRPPNVSFNEKVLKVSEALGYTVIDSSVDSKDITNPGAEAIAGNVLQPISRGDIVLMHASDSAKQTAKALPIIIGELKEKGYQFVTVSKLLSDADAKTNLIN